MSITIEVNLRVPDIKVPGGSTPATRIVNTETRFGKVVEVETLPKIGDALELSAGGDPLPVIVKRLDWVDDKNRFVAACQYGRRSMHSDEFEKLRADPTWTSRSLLGE